MRTSRSVTALALAALIAGCGGDGQQITDSNQDAPAEGFGTFEDDDLEDDDLEDDGG